MQSRPADLSDEDLERTLHIGWGLDAVTLEYVPVGFGSHHWAVVDDCGSRWFVTVDEPEKVATLRAALSTARRLNDTGLDFVVAPMVAADGDILRMESRFAVAVYPHVDGESFQWRREAGGENRRPVIELLARLHAVEPDVRTVVEDVGAPGRDTLFDSPGDTGPYAAPLAELLRDRRDVIEHAFAHYDDLATGIAPPKLVITHGEPHPGNTMRTAAGWKLVDWDTVRVAPLERDMWFFDTDHAEHYEALTGVSVEPARIELYRFRWDLDDLATYVRRFQQPHLGNADDDKSWYGVRVITDRLSAL